MFAYEIRTNNLIYYIYLNIYSCGYLCIKWETWPAQHSNTGSINGMSLGWGCLFVQPMADWGCVWGKPLWFEQSFFLVWCRKNCGNCTYLFLWFNFCVILTTISINLTDWTTIYNNNNIIISYLYERERLYRLISLWFTVLIRETDLGSTIFQCLYW